MKLLSKITLLFFSITCAAPSYALKMKPVTFQQLTAQSNAIALVEIESSKQIKTDAYSCGIEHRARVINSLKGNTKNKLNFGYMQGLETGKQYLVFLTDNNYTIFTTPNFQQQFSNKAALKECKKLQQASHTIAQAGMAFFKIQQTPLFNFKPGIKIKQQYFRIANNIKTIKDKHEPDTIWIRLDDALGIIKH